MSCRAGAFSGRLVTSFNSVTTACTPRLGYCQLLKGPGSLGRLLLTLKWTPSSEGKLHDGVEAASVRVHTCIWRTKVVENCFLPHVSKLDLVLED